MKQKPLINVLKTEHAKLCGQASKDADTVSKIKILEAKIQEIENPQPTTKKEK